MAVDFDTTIDRLGTYCTQWDYTIDRFGRSDVLPFSISDTDFAIPEEVERALLERMRHPIFGYTRWNHEDYKGSVISWFQKDGKAKSFSSDWVVYSPSVIFSTACLVRLITSPGEGVVLFTPHYDAFFGAIEGNGRKIVPVKQHNAMEGYGIDWEELERALSFPLNRVLILVNPHNPTGKVYTLEELERIYDLCHKYHVTIISDDIHRDIVFAPHEYRPILDIGVEGVLIVASASKTFNTPALGGSYCIIPDIELRERFLFELKHKNALSSACVLGMLAQMTAYSACEYYVQELVDYIAGNMRFVKEFLESELPEILFELPQGSYLAWMDVTKLGISEHELQQKLVNKGHVGIMAGGSYGDSRCLRMNIACPREKLNEGLCRMYEAIRG